MHLSSNLSSGLSYKVFIALLFACLIAIFAFFVNVISQSVVTRGVNEIEIRDAEADMKALYSLLGYATIRFKHHVFDWAVFDEAYDYIDKKNDTFIIKNFNQLKIDEMHFTGSAVYDNNGKRLSFVDGTKAKYGEKWVKTEEENFDRIAKMMVDKNNENIEGFIFIEDTAMIIAAHRIFDSAKEKPSNGYLIMGLAIDDTFREQAKNISGLHFSVLPLRVFNTLHGTQLKDNAKFLQTPNEMRIYSVVKNIFGEPAFCLELQEARNIAAFGREISHKNFLLMLILCVLVLCAGLMIVHFVQRHFTREEMNYRTKHDSLTGLPNGVLFQERLLKKIEESRLNGTSLGVLHINVNSFKNLNDYFGYNEGDLILREMTDRLGQSVTSGNLARQGADNFLAAITAKNQDLVIEKAQEIQNDLSKPFTVSGNTLHIETSIGIAFHNESVDDIPLVHQAEYAMTDAKKKEGNTIALYDEDMRASAIEKIHLEIALREAVANNAFTVYYQPKIDIVNKDVAGCEALIRWQSDNGKWIPPTVFIPIAEKTGLVTAIDMFVLRNACRQVLTWQKDGSGAVPIAVNMSVHSILSNGFADKVKQILEEEGTPPSLIDIEITESSFMTDIKKAFAAIYKLHKNGIHIALDDFGTGYSSLKYLSDMPISCLKIDKSFVDDIFSGKETAQPLVKSIISLASSLGIPTVSEGVEDRNQLAFLAGNGSNIIQGYIFSRPINPQACGEFLKNRKANIAKIL